MPELILPPRAVGREYSISAGSCQGPPDGTAAAAPAAVGSDERTTQLREVYLTIHQEVITECGPLSQIRNIHSFLVKLMDDSESVLIRELEKQVTKILQPVHLPIINLTFP